MNKPATTPFKYPSGPAEMPAGPYADAAVLVENNAGWRVFRPVIDGAKCVKCQKCWLLCPDGVIDRSGEVYAVDYNFCKGCGLCGPGMSAPGHRHGEKGDASD
jgi:pyruvate ferredoxin oxidoreductase delta subunit